jgi:UDP-N-acetylmuramoyl-tripeptide--D-alanyl-D-alanine ligase
MRPRSLADAAATVAGTLRQGASSESVIRGAAVDSRLVRPGDLFVALPGDRADGHAFVAAAIEAGASGALVRAGGFDGDGPVIEVTSPARALLELAADERTRMDGAVPVVGITGSTGKTCTKDLTAAVLGQRARVVASPASFNNEIGLPLTLLATDESTEAVVCEMGARGVGHIRLLCEIARPRIGVVTNVGTAHLGVFGSPEALRDAKAELPESLPPEGTAVLNADDPVVATYAERTAAEVVWYGSRAPVRAESVEVSRSTGAVAFDLRAPDGHAAVALRVPGEHMVSDALAAAAVGWALGIPVAAVAAGLSSATVSAGRMEVVDGPDGLRILNDSYNANPTSVAAAVRSARWMAGDGRFVAVLGPMAELGSIADEEHVRVGELLVRTGVDALIVVGEDARRIAAGAEREGLEPERIVWVGDPDEAARAARSLAGPGDLVLVKGSRVAGLERVVDALVAGVPAEEGDAS